VPVTGFHALIYTADAEAVRSIFRDVFGWKHVDAGDGWLIFALPPGELAAHPAEQPRHELCLMCDNLESTVAELNAKGIEFDGGPEDQGFGTTITMRLPGGAELLLYEPRHPTAV
jgi:catechol 2,3-dioxygenase-like lactoylglutathione lyase family enzyme